MGVEVLDIMFRRPGEAVGFLDLISFPDDDPQVLGGSVMTTDGSSQMELRIEAAQSDLSATEAVLEQVSDSELALVTDGTPSGYGVTALSTVSLVGGSWELSSGTFNDPDGNSIDFFAATDPVPAVVWIAGIAVVGCLLKVGIDALLLNCREQLSEDIKACANGGGRPTVTINTTYGFSSAGGIQVGCNASCSVECR